VVDNASTDGSAAMVKTEYPLVILIENQDNRGFAAANNQGMKIVKGRYVLLLNSDTIVVNGAIQKSVAFADQYPLCGVVGVRTFYSDGKVQPNCFQFFSLLNMCISMFGLNKILPRNRFFGRERMTWWKYDTIKKVDVVAGCYMLVRKDVIKNVGGMDEHYFMYGEEMDWCRRIYQKGWEIYFYPDASIVHYGGISSTQDPIRMKSKQRDSMLYYIQKHHGVLVKYVYLILLACGGAIRIPYWTIRWFIASKAARVSAKRKLKEILAVTFGLNGSKKQQENNLI